MSIDAMKQALEALENVRIEYDFHGNPADEQNKMIEPAIAALRQAIEQAEKQKQIAEDFIKYGASWSKRGKRIDPSEIYAPAQTPVHASDISQEHVDETVKSEHEFECPRCGHCCQQREWVGLTEQDVHDAFQFTELIKQLSFDRERPEWCENFAAYLEAKLKEKNT